VNSSVLLGLGRVTQEVLDEARHAAKTDSKVLITGESGVGKEVLAHLIHQHSHRAKRPMVAINCAGVPESLLESELFGHVRGSFTDAHADKRGLLEMADGGTVMLDEVGDMSMRMQTLLLRFLENGEIQRVGCERQRSPVDVRVIAATNHDLEARTKEKLFRLDLFYRLNVVHLVMPPLRERRDDIRPLFDHFLAMMADHYRLAVCTASDEMIQELEGYEWPGNIRELKNVAERLAVRHAGQLLTVRELPPQIAHRPVRAALQSATFSTVPPLVDVLYDRITRNGESFWSVVFEPFMSRDLTRETMRAVVRRGLECTKGNYRLIPALFNFPATDYKRFLTFLQKHDCHIPFRAVRSIAPPPAVMQPPRCEMPANVKAAG
jgi:two-component system, NtrC family, response regulator AtoC